MSTTPDFELSKPLEDYVAEHGANARRSSLDPYAPHIAQALERGLTYEQVADWLRANGIETTKNGLASFLRRRRLERERKAPVLEALGAVGAPAQPAPPSPGRRATDNPHASPEAPPLRTPTAAPAKAPAAAPRTNVPGAFNSPKRVSMDEFKLDESATEQNPLTKP